MAAQRRRKEQRQPQYETRTYLSLIERLAQNVARLRAEREWSQLQAAEHFEMGLYQFQRIEGGITNVTFATLARLCDGFGVPVEDLLKSNEPTRTHDRSRKGRK